MDIFENIQILLEYGKTNNLISEYDEIVARNSILSILNINNWEKPEKEIEVPLYPTNILNNILKYGVEKKIINNTIGEKDLLDTKIMGCLTPKPSQIINKFKKLKEINPVDATDYFYKFSQKTNYIRTGRIEKNMHWITPSLYGNIEITINLSKPEKDPRDIEKQKYIPASSYPKCLLCYENVGYPGNISHPARQNHRVIPITLENEQWFMQYSPYVYYNEHSIIFCKEHRPMKINKESFKRIFDFIDIFPHYFLGSNADLPIVGGSILNHDHYQGGYHLFPMAKTMMDMEISFNDFSDVSACILNWPLSVIRLNSKNKNSIIELGNKILEVWRNYSDESQNIIAYSNNIPHNTITPIARKRNDLYELDLVLRNNRTTTEYPLGIFHPHSDVHNIKKENIGLIEVMGLAVLPGRLKEEMEILSKLILEKNALEKIANHEKVKKHLNWSINILKKYKNINSNNINDILKNEIGLTFIKGLEDCGVFKRTPIGQVGFLKFINYINNL